MSGVLLVDYYRAFHAVRKTDPTGYNTLLEILGVEDAAAFQKKWERWVRALQRNEP